MLKPFILGFLLSLLTFAVTDKIERMKPFILGFLLSLLTFAVVGLCCLELTLRYDAAKKFYPEMTMLEYVLMKDHLRITPNGNKE